MAKYSITSIPTRSTPTTPACQGPLGCCSAADHGALLADLEVDALTDPDVARLQPRARYLLAGSTNLQSREVPS